MASATVRDEGAAGGVTMGSDIAAAEAPPVGGIEATGGAAVAACIAAAGVGAGVIGRCAVAVLL
jgi:hypothetical protein